MPLSPLAGKPATPDMLVDVARLVQAYHDRAPDMADPVQRVAFGTSGHRGTPGAGSFNEAHILAITQAICDYRRRAGIDGPVLVGKDTHSLSASAQRTALEVLAGNGVEAHVQQSLGDTPTPVISRAIIVHNRGRNSGLADGIIITPSHNPPSDGGFKYNPPNGGPAETDVTTAIQNRANELLKSANREVKRSTSRTTIKEIDYVMPYVRDLASAIDMDAIRKAKVKIGVDPLGGASLGYWEPIRDAYSLDLTIVNPKLDPAFSFMTLDHDGKIRMDCSSPYAMAGLVKLKDRFQVAFGADPDSDRHGIVTPGAGLLNPNHYLAVAIQYLLMHRPKWPKDGAVGKTLVSSSMIDLVVNKLGRTLAEVPVGFKWFADGLFTGSYVFGGEESAGASFLRTDGTVWTTDKDGILLCLLAAEIKATTGKDPGEHYVELTREFGTPHYTRIDAPATPQQKAAFKNLTAESVTAQELAGDPITARMTTAPSNNAPIGGLKITTAAGWFAARPSGTENIYKIYAESFKDSRHLQRIVTEAQAIVTDALQS